MLDRIRGLLGIDEDDEDDGPGIFVCPIPDERPDEAALVEGFEQVLDTEGVTVDGDRTDVVETFADIVSQYGELVPALRDLGERVGDDGVADVNVILDDDEIARWREDHPEAVTTIDTVSETRTAVFEPIEVADAVSDDDFPETVDAFVRQVKSLTLLTED